MNDRVGNGYWEKLGHVSALTLRSDGASARSWVLPLGVHVGNTTQTRNLTQFRNAYSPSKSKALWWVTAAFMRLWALITLMLHSPPHTIRCRVGFSAAYYGHYFKAAFQVSVGGSWSVFATPGCAVLARFQVLGQSLVVPRLIFWALESQSQPELLFCAFGVNVYLSWLGAPAPVNGKVLLSGVLF